MFIIVVALVAIVPAEQVVTVNKGDTALLRVFYSSTIPILQSNLNWFDPSNNSIPSGIRQYLMDSNQVLLIKNAAPKDNGNYMISIVKLRGFGQLSLVTSTMITLNVIGKLYSVYARCFKINIFPIFLYGCSTLKKNQFYLQSLKVTHKRQVLYFSLFL